MNDIKSIEKMIYLIRGRKVMLDSDLAELYGVQTKSLIRQVKRNIKRFPEDFAFQLSNQEHANLRYQIGTSSLGHGGRRYLPMMFTENGVAMLSSVLKSDRAIEVNIAIMRIFTKLRSYVVLEEGSIEDRLEKLEKETRKTFKIVFKRLDSYEEMIGPRVPERRKKIGLK